MRAGDLDTRVQLLKRALATDDVGQSVESWSVYAVTWAQAIGVTGRERLSSAHEITEYDMRFRIRYREGIDTTWRVGYEGKEFDIYAVNEIGRDEGLELLAKYRG